MSRRAGPGRGNYARIYAVIRRIPRGRVATYGQVAELAGLPGHARQVGYALHALPAATAVPWHRVINAAGGVSLRSSPGALLGLRPHWRPHWGSHRPGTTEDLER